MAIHLLFPESGVRFILSNEDAKRLIYQEAQNRTRIEIFKNFDFRKKSVDIQNTKYNVCRYVIAFAWKDFCILGDEGLGSFYSYIPVDAESHTIGNDEYFPYDFELYRVYINAPQRYEET